MAYRGSTRAHRMVGVATVIGAGIICWGVTVAATSDGNRQEPVTRIIFSQRPKWASLPTSFLDTLATRFSSKKEAEDFAACCERSAILTKTIIPLVNRDKGDLDLGWIAVALTSYGNSLGGEGKLNDARNVFLHAVRLKERYEPTWESLSLCEFYLGNCAEAVRWADKVLSFRPDSLSSDVFEQGLATAAESARAEEASAVLGIEDYLAGQAEVREQMMEIKRQCAVKMKNSEAPR